MLEELCELISEKLQCNLKFLQLCYHLDSSKQTPILIGSQDEFAIFMDCMRDLHIPMKLVNGKMSTHTLKPVTISFEDGADWDNSSMARSSQSGGKKVCSNYFFQFVNAEQPIEGIDPSYKLGRLLGIKS